MKQSWDEQPPSNEQPHGPCVNLMSALVDLLEIFTSEKSLLVEAIGLLGDLEVEDPVRRKYWKKRELDITSLMEKIIV